MIDTAAVHAVQVENVGLYVRDLLLRESVGVTEGYHAELRVRPFRFRSVLNVEVDLFGKDLGVGAKFITVYRVQCRDNTFLRAWIGNLAPSFAAVAGRTGLPIEE